MDSPDYKTKIGAVKTGQVLLILTIFSEQWLTHMRKVFGWFEMTIEIRKNQLATPKTRKL